MEPDDLLKIARLAGLKNAKIKEGCVWLDGGERFDPENSDAQIWKVLTMLIYFGRFDMIDDAFASYTSFGSCFQSMSTSLNRNVLCIALLLANDKLENRLEPNGL